MTSAKTAVQAMGLALTLALLGPAPAWADPIPEPTSAPPAFLIPGYDGATALGTFLDCLASLEAWAGKSLPDWVVHSSPFTYSARKPRYDATGRPLTDAGGRQVCDQVALTGRIFYPPTWRVPFQRTLPLVVYTHATTMLKRSVASAFGGNEWMLGAAAALYYGFAVAMPDAPGMGGDGGSYHPFCHAKSLAYSTLDGIPAMRRRFAEDPYLVRGGYQWDGRLVLMGYSEGAYTALAAVKELEEHPDHYPDITLTGSACMAGPFDLSNLARTDILTPMKPFAHCFYLPYVILGYHSVYGQVLDPIEVFAPELLETREDGNILQWADGTVNGLVMDELIGKRLGKPADQVTLRSILNPAWLARELDDPAYATSTIRRLLEENDLHRGWRPTKPILFCQSPADQDIPYQDTITTLAFLGAEVVKAGGDPSKVLRLKPIGNHGGPLSHVAAALWAIPMAFDWIYGGLKMDPEPVRYRLRAPEFALPNPE